MTKPNGINKTNFEQVCIFSVCFIVEAVEGSATL